MLRKTLELVADLAGRMSVTVEFKSLRKFIEIRVSYYKNGSILKIKGRKVGEGHEMY